MPPAVKLALLTLPPIVAACLGALVAALRPPRPATSSLIQHFTAGIVFSAAALELLPKDRTYASLPVVVGFALGLGLMLAIRALSRVVETRLETARLPVSLIIVTAIDLLIDGLVLEVLFLALSVSAALAAAGIGRTLAIAIPMAMSALLSLAAVIGNAVFSGLPPTPYAALLGLGTVALLYLVTEELLTEAHEVPDTPLATAAFFVGFVVFFLLEGAVGG
ncbi:hypothetical protein [Burkholderia gladioli]|uniref:hypothetical protein n=1 Tax=Burkholderia gladioli TaxID=28095 RepID=UPI0016405E12|nr:hypothetical protein [Burkholderia gladioli]